MSKDLSARYYQKKKKKGFNKKAVKSIKNFPKKGKTKSKNMVAKNIKTFLKMKNKGWLNIEKVLQNVKK